MPQIFQVLRCYKCSVFQVHQAKKSNKFECKMCGEKQSIKRHYGIGNAKECRSHVQRLNKIRGEVAETGVSSQCDTDGEDIGKDENVANSSGTNKTSSKWSNYIESPSDSPEDNKTEFLNNQEVVLEMPRKIPRKNYYVKKSKKYSKNGNNSDDDIKSFLDSNENNGDEIQLNKENVSASKRKTIFVQPVLKYNFKPDNDMDDTTLNNDIDTNYSCSSQASKENTNLVHKSPKLEIISSSSKWAQYVEDDNKDQDSEKSEEDEYVNDEKAENNIDNRRKSDGAAIRELFSQCDDEDWDNVLSF